MEYFTIINSALLLAIGGQVLALRRQNSSPMIRRKDRMIILDSCALIDGRIIDLVKLGFMKDTLVIPQSVIAELQYLADHGDSHKRERARFGLDVVRELQDIAANTVIDRTPNGSGERIPVDEQLIIIAQRLNGLLYTTDFNLNKVAQIHGVEVLNVNELTQRLRAKILPGEQDSIKIVSRGQDKTQGVGYLDDGTMVVVERAGNKVGQTVSVQFSRALQTQAGRMMFATMPGGSTSEAKSSSATHAKAPKAEEVVILQQAVKKQAPATKPAKHVQPAPASDKAAPVSAAPPRRRERAKKPEDALMALVASQDDEPVKQQPSPRSEKTEQPVSEAKAGTMPRRVYHARPKKQVRK